MVKIQFTSLHTPPITRQRCHSAPKYWPLLPDALPSLEGVWLGMRLVPIGNVVLSTSAYQDLENVGVALIII